MKLLLILAIMLTQLSATWETNPNLYSIGLAKDYQAEIAKREKAKRLCLRAISRAQNYRDIMDKDNELDQAKLKHMIGLVTRFCPDVINCNCKKERK